MMKKYVILHGHFYQPPREDPWSGLIEHQDSAAPYFDWNRRITAECYAACGASRILDSNGAILSILNNYRYLSFNFGPTLLSWMDSNAPKTYRRILAADRESIERLGYGNAVAQGYNHTILPLDEPKDALTQIRWGLADFSHRFERDADGMWLPECAVNYSVIDKLINEGMKYVILSPWQAHSLRNDKGEWKALNDKPAPSDRPFYIDRPGGRIAVFFYNPDLASGISFGHLLRSREGFEKALRDALARSDAPMVSIATDGEIYGHHEPYGDMCLSALIDHLGSDSDLIFTNYAAYLDANPPALEVKLRTGDEHRGTSWSCVHGVGRWMRDCGCSTGGKENWNQAWRSSLREAFDGLRMEAEPVWTGKVEALTGKDAREVLDSYGKVLSGAEEPHVFAMRILGEGASRSIAQDLLIMLEGAKFLQFMYTSCGWFFSELSGIEPVQNMSFAYRAAELIDSEGTAKLTAILNTLLSRVESNLSSMGNGSDLLRGLIIPKFPTEVKAAALFFWRNLYNLPGMDKSRWGTWEGRGITRRIVGTGEERLKLEGDISYTELSTLRRYKFEFRSHIDSRLFSPSIDILMDSEWISVPISAMPTALRMEIQKKLLNESEMDLKGFLGSTASERLLDLMIVQALDLPFGASGWQSLELSLHYGPLLILDQLEKLPADSWPKLLESMDEILTHCESNGVDTNFGSLEYLSGRLVSRIAGNLQLQSNRQNLEQLVNFLEIIQLHGLHPLKPTVQNAVYGLLEKRFNCAENSDEIEGECPSNEDLIDLARLVNINPERFT